MKKVILVDGNNLMFRSFYATLYSGSMMTNSEGFPTNALYGFVNMMNKIISEEKPEYILVAFDIGKTFLGSLTTKDINPYLKTNSKKEINFPKSIISINNINSLPISRHSALTSSTRNIYIKNISRQINSSRQYRPNSQDNIKKGKKKVFIN